MRRITLLKLDVLYDLYMLCLAGMILFVFRREMTNFQLFMCLVWFFSYTVLFCKAAEKHGQERVRLKVLENLENNREV